MADTQTNNTSTKGVVRINGLVSSSIDSALDEDWFRIVGLVAGHTYQIDLLGLSSGFGTLFDPLIFGVYTSGGSFIPETIADDVSPENFDSQLIFTPSSSGTYYINAANADDSSTGTYVLAVTDLDAPDLPATNATTGVVTIGTDGVQGNIDFAGDIDRYKVTLTAGLIYRVSMTGLDGFGGTLSDTVIEGIRYNGTLVPFTGNDDFSGLSSQVEFMATGSGVHYIDVAGYPGATGTFRLAVQEVTPLDIAGNTSTSVTLTVNAAQPHLNRIGLFNPADVDWFRVTLNAGTKYYIEGLGLSTGMGSHGDPRITGIYNSVGTLVGAGDDDGGLGLDALTFFTPTTAGTYYVGIDDARTTDVAGLYRVSVRTGSRFDLPANATTMAEAVVGPNGVLGRIDTANDVDWFRAALLPGHIYRIDLQSYNDPSDGTALADPFLRGLYYGDGTLIDGTANDDFGTGTDSRVTFTSPGGTLYIAAGAYGTATGNYQLTVTDVTPADLAASTATTGTIAVNTIRNGRIELAGDEDWFKTTLAASTMYEVQLSRNGSSPLPLNDPFFLGVHNSLGNLIANTTNDDWGETFDSRITFTSGAAGTYYLAAGGFGDETGDYVLSLTKLGNIVDAISDNISTTGTVAVGGTAGSTVDSPFDEDWFRVTLVANQAYVIDLRGAPSGNGTLLDPSLIGVFDAAGQLIPGTPNDDVPGSLDSQTVFKPTKGGTYFIGAGGFGSDTGTYKISIATTTVGSDVAANITTTANVALGGSFAGTVETTGDVDWIRLAVSSGSSYIANLRGSPSGNGTLADPEILGVFDANGAALNATIQQDTTTPVSLDSRANFTTNYTGNAYVAVRAHNSGTGTYKLAVTAGSDAVAPTLVSSTPADNATNVSRTNNLSFTFSEAVKAGSGNITVSANDGTQSQVISVTDATKVSFSGDTLTINPGTDLLASKAYTVKIADTAVKDIAGNSYNFNEANPINFTTTGAAAADTWTIMVYVDGDNNLENFALRDLNEMESISGLNALGINVMVMADRVPGFSSGSGDWKDTRQAQIVPDANTTTVSTLANAATSVGEKNMGNPASLTGFINWAKTNAPAQNYALVVWDHGGGLSGAAWDDSSAGDNLSIAEIRSAIDASDVAKFDLIGFDCCQMAMTEMAFAIRDLTDVFVASEENEPGDGWAYDAVLGAMKANPTMSDVQLGTTIVNTYAASYAGQADITLAAVTTAQLNAVEPALINFINKATTASAADKAAMTAAAGATVHFPSDGSAPWGDVIDFMEEVMARTATVSLDNAAKGVIDAYGAAIFSQAGTVPEAEGLSINLPFGNQPVQGNYTAANFSMLNTVPWDQFLAVI